MKKEVGVIAFIILFSVIVSASVSLQNEQLKKNYIEGDLLSGKIFLNLTNESTDSQIKSSIGGNISLIAILNSSGRIEGNDYRCDIVGCKRGYIPAEKLSGNVPITDEILLGFKLNGKSISIPERAVADL